jgi:phosphoribosylformimino-5-aminoimidazole carboxamide ribotide isomerase
MPPFEVLPAIDLAGGRAVRLVRGARESAAVVGEPLELVTRWGAAPLIHVVDLDGAFEGAPVHGELVAAMAQRHAIQVGGGLRTFDDCARVIDRGVARVVVGTAVLHDPALLDRLLVAFGAVRVVVAIDVKDGRVAVRGWTEAMAIEPRALAARLAGAGVVRVLCTAVHRDGTLEGPDLAVLDEVAVAGLRVTASGGIATLDDVRAVRRYGGVVIGKALYAGRFTLREALECC